MYGTLKTYLKLNGKCGGFLSNLFGDPDRKLQVENQILSRHLEESDTRLQDTQSQLQESDTRLEATQSETQSQL